MIPFRDNPEIPSPPRRAAYPNGDLDDAARIEVEAWLAEHPEAAAEVEAQHDLTRLWRAALPPEPTEAQWAAALSRIEAGLAPQTAPAVPVLAGSQERPSRRVAWGVAFMRWTAAAAAVLFLATLERWDPPQPSVVPVIEPLPVASPEDVDILSVHGRDMAMLVVGAPPLHEPLALASAEEVVVESVQPDVDGMTPQVRLTPPDPMTPMLVAPIVAALPRERAP